MRKLIYNIDPYIEDWTINLTKSTWIWYYSSITGIYEWYRDTRHKYDLCPEDFIILKYK